MTGLEALEQVGQAVFGRDWQRAMARALGPLHPSGARDHVDDRLMRRWIAAERELPGWVPAALPDLLNREAARMAGDAERLRALAAEIKGRLQAAQPGGNNG